MAEFNSCAHLLDNIDEATEEYCKVKEWENYDVSPLNEMLKMQNEYDNNMINSMKSMLEKLIDKVSV